MMNVDQLLTTLVNNQEEELKNSVMPRDMRILISLAKGISNPNFITENQGRLLLKIFSENRKKMSRIVNNLDAVLEAPTWSKPFRLPDTTKKIYISHITDENSTLTVEFAFSTTLKKKLTSLSKALTGLVQEAGGKKFHADFTERNIVTLIDNFKDSGFDIDEKLMDFYKIAKSWDETEVKNQFLINNATHEQLLKKLKNEIGDEFLSNETVLKDRSIRYQFFTENSQKNPENLTEIIANRNSTRIWVDTNKFDLEELFKSLVELNRLPVLLVFDSYSSKNSVEELKKIDKILEKMGINENVGIYFRLANNDEGKDFNQIIKEKNYNCRLDSTTKVVGVQSGKIPKFLLKTDWTPMSVISIGTNLNHNKTSVYANCCDLVITYSSREPLFEPKLAWV